MGPLTGILGMLPGLPKEVKKADIDDRELDRVEAIVRSMTPEERRSPTIVNGSRRLRIANGCGRSTTDVNNLLKQFKEMQKMMKGLGGVASRKAKKSKGGRVTPPKLRSMG